MFLVISFYFIIIIMIPLLARGTEEKQASWPSIEREDPAQEAKRAGIRHTHRGEVSACFVTCVSCYHRLNLVNKPSN